MSDGYHASHADSQLLSLISDQTQVTAASSCKTHLCRPSETQATTVAPSASYSQNVWEQTGLGP